MVNVWDADTGLLSPRWKTLRCLTHTLSKLWKLIGLCSIKEGAVKGEVLPGIEGKGDVIVQKGFHIFSI